MEHPKPVASHAETPRVHGSDRKTRRREKRRELLLLGGSVVVLAAVGMGLYWVIIGVFS